MFFPSCFIRTVFCLALLLLAAAPARADRDISVVVHVHSSVSSGFKTVRQISDTAAQDGVDAVILTDLLYEHYEYGLWPMRSVIKKSFERPSIVTYGAERYLEDIRRANLENPDTLLLDGTVATPFYYWSGSPWPGPLVMNHRAVDLLVLGLGDAASYERLPVVGRPTSRFNPYEGEQGPAPYQALIDHVGDGALVYWSHPLAEENYQISDFLLPKPVSSITKAYPEILLNTSGYTGYAIYSVGLNMLADDPNGDPLSAAGGIWDKILGQYCRGNRPKPVWVVGESDYNARENNRLGSILNLMNVREISRGQILRNLAQGAYYVVSPERSGVHLSLNGFRAEDGLGAPPAEMGQEGDLNGEPVLKFSLSLTDASQTPLRVIVIRNGRAVNFLEETTPFTGSFRDAEAPVGRKSYYRIIAKAQNGGALISNPIFFERKA